MRPKGSKWLTWAQMALNMTSFQMIDMAKNESFDWAQTDSFNLNGYMGPIKGVIRNHDTHNFNTKNGPFIFWASNLIRVSSIYSLLSVCEFERKGLRTMKENKC